jgi:outer membrane receptor protein involved in Fe transport
MMRIQVTILSLLFPVYAIAQTARIECVVQEEASKAAVEYAVVGLFPAELYTVTNANGEFAFDKVDAGNVRLRIQFIGKESIDTVIQVKADQVNRYTFRMKADNFRLDEVVVIAAQNKSGMATSSTISRQAIDHIQATSLSDVLQLLPGVAISNPGLNSANRVTIRGSGETNSLGSAIIVDGVQLSNNANMQSFAATMNGSTGGAASGIDTRTIPLDNIESIEVIRGIPSAEYGDLTSGAVIVKSRAGRDPLRVKIKTHPELYQGSISKGIFFGDKAGALNVSGDYAYTIKSPTEAYAFYQRLATKALWTATFGSNLYATTSLGLAYGKDTRGSNPDDTSRDFREGSRDVGVNFSHNAIISLNKGWLKTIEYMASGSFNDKRDWSHERLNNASGLYSTSMVDGAVVSKMAGQRIYDNAGNEVTNLQGAETAFTSIMPNEYYHDYDIFGKEINASAKIKVNLNKSWGVVNNRIIAGVDFKTDGNTGKGKVYDEERPPLRTTSGNRAYRERPFTDIPFMNQLGIFLEDRYLHSFGNRDLHVGAGLRYDWVNGKSRLSPRINASFDILPGWFTLRGGYGITAKAPTLLYLYPENAYFDYRLTTSVDYNQYLLTKTRVFAAVNPDLDMAVNRKIEVGFDTHMAKKRVSVTVYDELMENGYSYSTGINSIRLVEDQRYTIDHVEANGTPVLRPENTYNVFAVYSQPANNVYIHNRGVEYELELGRFNAIRTSFYLNGAYMRRTTKTGGYAFSMQSNGNRIERNIGVYGENRYSSENERMLTTLRITHNIPEIGFVITLTPQLCWYDKAWTVYNANYDMFEKYISYHDGKVYDFHPDMKDDPEFSYLFPGINTNRGKVEKAIPTLFFNINLSKEIGDTFTASFFANNMFNSHPMYESTVTPGSFIELGQHIFFGFDLKINIK